jgi:hypothetical protein
MKSCWWAAVMFALAASATAAQEELQIFGYFEPQYMGTHISARYYQLFTNKLRVDIKSELSDNITFAANINAITYHGKKEWNILDFLAPDIRDAIPEALRPLYTLPFENQTLLDNAYARLTLAGFDLTIGKQQISLGTGYVWNPTDIFNVKDVLDPTYEQPGHNAARLDIQMGGRHTATLLYAPEASWNESGKLLQLKGGAGRFDYTLILIETLWTFHDYSRFDAGSLNFVALPEKRRLWGGSAVGELLGLGVWAELAFNTMELSPDFYELVLGSDYTFDFQTYFMVEYYRNTLGKSDYRTYGLNDWMRFFTSEQKSVTRDQLYSLVQHPVTDLLGLGLQCLLSLSDGSWSFVPFARHSLSDNTELFAYLNLNIGSEGKTYGRSLGRGGLLRLRVYF